MPAVTACMSPACCFLYNSGLNTCKMNIKNRVSFIEGGGSGAIKTQAYSVKEKYVMPYNIQSQCLWCFLSQRLLESSTDWSINFCSLLVILQSSKKEGLLQASNTHIHVHVLYHIVVNSMVMSYMKELHNCVNQ